MNSITLGVLSDNFHNLVISRSFNKFGGITCYLGANYLQLEHNNNEIGKGLAYQ